MSWLLQAVNVMIDGEINVFVSDDIDWINFHCLRFMSRDMCHVVSSNGTLTIDISSFLTNSVD